MERINNEIIESASKLFLSVVHNVFKLINLKPELLGEKCYILGGGSLPNIDVPSSNGEVLLLKVGELNKPENTPMVTTASSTITLKAAQGMRLRVIPPNSVIIPKRGGAISTNKKRLLAKYAVLDPNLMAIVPKDSNYILPWYLLYWFESIDLSLLSSGSSVPQLNRKDLYPLNIKVPYPQEQIRIVSVFKWNLERS